VESSLQVRGEINRRRELKAARASLDRIDLDFSATTGVDPEAKVVRLAVWYHTEETGAAEIYQAVKGAGFQTGTDSLRLRIRGIYCSGCISQIEEALRGVAGVEVRILAARGGGAHRVPSGEAGGVWVPVPNGHVPRKADRGMIVRTALRC
jgi:copper chaperone CopZ